MQKQPMAKIPAQLHIGNLETKAQEYDVYKLLRQFGDIAKIRLCPGTNSAYAFVAFKDPDTANRARKELNGFEFAGRHLTVSKITAQRGPVANLFVKNFSENVTVRDLEELFSKTGTIISSKVCYDDSGRSLGYGFVQFESTELAEAAIKNHNGKIWNNSELTVQKFVPLDSRIVNIPNSNLYVRGFPISYTDQDLKNIFSQYGKVLSVALMADNGRAYGFVGFSNAEEAKEAWEGKNNTVDGDFTWYVTPHMSKIHRKKVLREQYLKQIEEWKKKNLYIRNLDKSIDEEKLADICREYGPIKSLKICKMENIKYDSDGNCSKESISKEIAYVYFESEQSAIAALSELQRKLIQNKKLYVAKWKPRDALRKLINSSKTQKSLKYPQIQGRGFMPPRTLPRFPIMGRAGFPNYPQMMPPRAKFSRAIPTQQMSVPIIENKKVPAMKAEEISRYTTRDLGEKLYPMVLAHTNTSIVGKITGMLLEMEKIEIINLINDETRLMHRVKEAVEVLRKAWTNDPAALAILP